MPQSPISGIIHKAEAFQHYSKSPHKIAELHIVFVSHKCFVYSVTGEFQTFSGINISTKIVCQELHAMGLHERAAPVGGPVLFFRLYIKAQC